MDLLHVTDLNSQTPACHSGKIPGWLSIAAGLDQAGDSISSVNIRLIMILFYLLHY